MKRFNTLIIHDSGTHNVEAMVNDEEVLITFGASFTLRLDESNLNKLRVLIHEAARELTIERRDTTGFDNKIDGREKLKSKKMTKDTVLLSGNWNPNDPSNW
jgi:hypothetical protein